MGSKPRAMGHKLIDGCEIPFTSYVPRIIVRSIFDFKQEVLSFVLGALQTKLFHQSGRH